MNYIVVSEEYYGGNILAIFHDKKNAEGYKRMKENELNLDIKIIEKKFEDAEADNIGLTCDKCMKVQLNVLHKHCPICYIFCCENCCQDVLCEICGGNYETLK